MTARDPRVDPRPGDGLRIIVCGGRHYSDYGTVERILSGIHDLTPIRHLYHGNATGADQLGDTWGRRAKISVHPVPAQWKKYGLRAGPIRNQHMLGQRIDLVVAFPGGRGTADMVNRAKKAGVRVMEIDQ